MTPTAEPDLMPTAAPASTPAPADRVVFFLGGFDPKGPGYYHRLMRDEAAKRSDTGWEPVQVGTRARAGPHAAGWDLRFGGGPGDSTTLTQLRFLRWDDIVRRHWARGRWQWLADYAQTYGSGLRHRIFRWYRRHAFGVWVLAMLPAVVGLLTVAAGMILAAVVGAAAGWPEWLGPLLAALPTLWAWRTLEQRLETEWLLRLYCFTHDQARGQLPELETRLDEFAATLRSAAQHTSAKEVLLVGYSTGSFLAATVLARALKQADGGMAPASRYALLTLGHCTPLLALFPQAQAFRDELRSLATNYQLTWIDFSAPADMATFGRVDPWMGASTGCKQRRSPRWHAAMDAARYRRLRLDRREMHLQYLRAPVGVKGQADAEPYDFFALIAGPMTLNERFCNAPAGVAP
jgi:hypothetical protein